MSTAKVNLLGTWVGEIYGTHHCHAMAEFALEESTVKLELRLPPTPSTALALIFIGKLQEHTIEASTETKVLLSKTEDTADIKLQVTLSFQAINDDVLQGNWEATNGAKGVIQLSRHKSLAQKKNVTSPEPTEIIAREYRFGNLRIYKKDIEEIIKIMEALVMPDGAVFVTEEFGGVKKIALAKVYLGRVDKPDELSALTIAAQRNVNGFTYSFVLNLIREGISTLSVQSPDLLWFYSTPMAVKELLEKRSDKIIDFYRKHGLNFNALLFLALLVWLPNLIMDRAVLVGSFVIFVLLHAFIHKRASISLINPTKEVPTKFKEKHPTFSYIALTGLSALIAAIIKYGLEHWNDIVLWVQGLFHA